MVGLEMNSGQEMQGNRKTLDVTKPLGKQQLRMQHEETEGENYEKTTGGVPTMVKISTGGCAESTSKEGAALRRLGAILAEHIAAIQTDVVIQDAVVYDFTEARTCGTTGSTTEECGEDGSSHGSERDTNWASSRSYRGTGFGTT